MPYVEVIANKIGVTQSVNGSWIQAIAEATFSGGGTGSTPGGITQSVQYNDGSGGFTGDDSFTREYTGGINDSFFANSIIGTSEMAVGAGDWTPKIGVPIEGSGLIYSEGDIFSGVFASDTSALGGGIGLTIINQDDATGDTAFIESTYEGTSISLNTTTAANTISMDNTIVEAKFDDFSNVSGWILESAGVSLKAEDVSGVPFQTVLLVKPTTVNISTLPDYDDDTAAGVGGLTTGDMYQTTGSGSSPLNVAGIMMIKQ
jgi:hypothetical protein